MFTDFLQRRGFWLYIAVCVAVSLVFRMQPVTPDVSWLIAVSERVLVGDVAYVYFTEANPPISAFLYMPGVVLASITPMSSELAVYGLTYLGYTIALFTTSRILPAQFKDIGSSNWVIIAPAALGLFVLSFDAFAQRETIAAAFALPIVAVFIRYLEDGHWAPAHWRATAIILAGLSIAIKFPLFVLPGLTVAAYIVAVTRQIRILYSSGLILAATLGTVLTAASLAVFPEYLETTALLMRDLYVPVREPLGYALSRSSIIGAAGAILVTTIMLLAFRPSKIAIMFLLIAVSYFVVVFIQGKYFWYHAAPACIFGLIAANVMITKRLRESSVGKPYWRNLNVPIYAIIALFITTQMFRGFDDYIRPIESMDWAETLDQPTTIAITPFIGMSFPLARDINAKWIDQYPGQWAMLYARIRLKEDDLNHETRARIHAFYESERVRLQTLIKQQQPDIIIQSLTPSSEWLNKEILVGASDLLSRHQIIYEDDRYRIWHRRDVRSQ